MTQALKIRFIFIFMMITVFVIRLITNPYYFADFDSYIILTDRLSVTPVADWITYEPFSSLVLFILRLLAGNSYDAVVAAYWYVSIIFLIGLFFIVRQQGIIWQGAVITLGLYGPLLAFVTVRATPAYLLICLAAIKATEGKLISLAIALLATGFHISAVLAIPPLLVALAQRRFGLVDRMFKSRRTTIAVALITFIALGFFYEQMLEFLNNIVTLFDTFLGKYFTYIKSDSEKDVSKLTEDNSFHQIYLIIVTLFVAMHLFQNDAKSVQFRGYILISYMIFAFLGFSPVASFRQSFFWVMPLILFFPWQNFSFNGLGSIVLLFVSCLMFYAGFLTVIQ